MKESASRGMDSLLQRRIDENLSPAFRATGRDVNGGYAEYMTVPENYSLSDTSISRMPKQPSFMRWRRRPSERSSSLASKTGSASA